MKIAIYEPIHLDWVLPYCAFFTHLPHEVSFFTSATFESDLTTVLGTNYSRFTFYYFSLEEGRQVFRQKIKQFFSTQSWDVIVLNSIDFRHLLLFEAIRSSTATVLLNVHDINNFFCSPLSLHPKKLVRTIGKRLLRKRASGFIVNASAMKEYILSHQLTTKPVYWLPPVITQAKPPAGRPGVPVLTVPGSIDEKRRDYHLVLQVFQKLAEALSYKIRLVLAGRPVGVYGEMILAKARELQRLGIDITVYAAEIPEVLFQDLVSQSSLLWSPLCASTAIHDAIEETYGQTKVSGNMYDAIRHGKPLLVPEWLTVPKELESSCIRYGSAEEALRLASHFFLEEDNYLHLSQKAYGNAHYFSLERGIATLNQMLRAAIATNSRP